MNRNLSRNGGLRTAPTRETRALPGTSCNSLRDVWGAQAASLLAAAACRGRIACIIENDKEEIVSDKLPKTAGWQPAFPRRDYYNVNATTRGILLRKRKLSDTSLIVSWCTNSLGIIQTVARGARRPRSPFRGQLDLFFEAELSIAKSRKSNLHTLREVLVVNAFAGIRTDHRRTQAASYFVELIEVCTEIEHHEPEIFHLLERAFGYLDQYDPEQRAILHFETELARITGVQRAKSNAAMALAHLFGKLPSSRPALLKSLASDKDGS